jgi:hypothetical protein
MSRAKIPYIASVELGSRNSNLSRPRDILGKVRLLSRGLEDKGAVPRLVSWELDCRDRGL